ncbi:hypothetical protein A5819_003559 [Enterococcus sp. 7E2_DIV0204]|uniref:CPBP family intramembrane glutamic endopeptidase n=1 Tax=unclassified Enterococcus TaxID=2608891 RepID=UPI000A35451F|nr:MULTISPECIES: type II CAAX endopeptidase family protein [unclassified Enterococcus]OTN84009.1 hypothetical protein A5819_003559 [Enterococcus sp. 7E2_DIV0204]OTP47212.1 hypothetical protein A5884_003587 [Enterococcus sp. 7D2_DIV0200]
MTVNRKKMKALIFLLLYSQPFFMYLPIILIHPLLKKIIPVEYLSIFQWVIISVFSLLAMKYIFFRKELNNERILHFIGLKPIRIIYLLEGVIGGGILSMIVCFTIFKNLSINMDFDYKGILLATLIGFVPVLIQAGTEEIIFRGTINSICEKKLKISSWTVSLFSSVLFGMIHWEAYGLGKNPAALWMMLAAFLMGIVLSGVTFLSNSLWIAIGIHTIWNVLESSILEHTIGKEKVTMLTSNNSNFFFTSYESNRLTLIVLTMLAIFTMYKLIKNSTRKPELTKPRN